MPREWAEELDDVQLDDDDFDIPTHEKGMRTEKLPNDMHEDEDSRVFPSSKGSMVKETLRQQKSKKKKGTK